MLSVPSLVKTYRIIQASIYCAGLAAIILTFVFLRINVRRISCWWHLAFRSAYVRALLSHWNV